MHFKYKGMICIAQLLELMCKDDSTWFRAIRALRKALTAVQFANAMLVLGENRHRAPVLHAKDLKAFCADRVSVLRNAARKCPDLPSIGVPEWQGELSPQSFKSYIDSPPAGPLRPTPTDCGPALHTQRWLLDRVPHTGILCLGRAGNRVRTWRRESRAPATAPPPLELAAALVHPTVAPTAVASRADHYWLTDMKRYMTVREQCRLMGLDVHPPLAAALEEVSSPTVAGSLIGKGIHAGAATCVLQAIDSLGLLPPAVNYASVCSGVDCFAAAIAALRPDAFHYRYAAERDTAARKVLARAWGIPPECMHKEAAELDTANHASVGLAVISPDCVRFSRRRHEASVESHAESLSEGAAEVYAVLGIVRRRAAAVVVLENVAERDAIAIITSCLHRAGGYKWRMQIVSPHRHAGKPCERERAFWVGVRS